jgi:hypothetical protein
MGRSISESRRRDRQIVSTAEEERDRRLSRRWTVVLAGVATGAMLLLALHFGSPVRPRPRKLPAISFSVPLGSEGLSPDQKSEVFTFKVYNPGSRPPYMAHIVLVDAPIINSVSAFAIDDYEGAYLCWSSEGHEAWILAKNAIAVLSESGGQWAIHQGYVDRNVPKCLASASRILFDGGAPSGATATLKIRQCATLSATQCYEARPQARR